MNFWFLVTPDNSPLRDSCTLAFLWPCCVEGSWSSFELEVFLWWALSGAGGRRGETGGQCTPPSRCRGKAGGSQPRNTCQGICRKRRQAARAGAPVGQHGGDTVATRGCGAREQCWGGRGTRPERPPLHSGSHLYQSTQPQSERLLDRAAGPAVWGAPDVQGGKRPSLQHPSK